MSASGRGARTTAWKEHRFILAASGTSGLLELGDASSRDAAGGFIDHIRLCPIKCNQNLLTNGSFEDPRINDRSYKHPAQIPGWELARGQKFEIQRNIMGTAAEGQQYVELASNAPIAISQKVATTAGGQYLLEVAYSARPGYEDIEVAIKGRTHAA